MTPKEFFNLNLRPGDRVNVSIGTGDPVPAFFDGYRVYTPTILDPVYDMFPIFRAVSKNGKMLSRSAWPSRTPGVSFREIGYCIKDYGPKEEVRNFFFVPRSEREDLVDSLLFNSGQEVLYGEVGDVSVSVVVCGEVRICWKGNEYNFPSSFPNELKDAIRKGTLDEIVSQDEDSSVINNNWFEMRIQKREKLVQTDVINDLSGMNADDARNLILDSAKEFLETGTEVSGMPFVCIAVFGEYDCKTAIDETREETHTVEEWKNIFKEKNCSTEVHYFQTQEEMDAFASGVERADNYFSSDFYTVMVLKDRITKG